MRCLRAIRPAIALVLVASAPGAQADVQVAPLQANVTGLSLTLLALPSGVPSTRFATARAINASGQIVGWYGAGAGTTSNPLGFLATTSGSSSVFPATPPPPPPSGRFYNWDQPYDINATGVVVGQAQTRTSANVDPFHYAFGDSNPAVPLLPTMREGEATGINNAGQVVGWETNGSTQAFYFNAGSASSIPFQGSVAESRALGINNGGQIAGYYARDGSGFQGFVYDVNSKALTELGSITVKEPTLVNGWRDSYDAVSINNEGQVAATRLTADGNHAVLFEDGQVTDLGVLVGYQESFAAGIGDAGWVVGYLLDASQQKTGFLWANGEMIDFSNARLKAYGATGWDRLTVVHDAYCCSYDSKSLTQTGIIVGEGILSDGTTRAFSMQLALQVPEPHTYLMLGLGLLAIGALRVRRLAPHH